MEEARRETPVVLVDFHGEATSEKVALAVHLDGKVTAVFGTHTHIQTNDARVQPGGTTAISDAGMTGPHDSVIGVKSELAIRRMRTGMPVRFETAEGGVRLEGALSNATAPGRASAFERSGSCSARPRTTTNSSATSAEVSQQDEPGLSVPKMERQLPVAVRNQSRVETAPAEHERRCQSTSAA